MKTDTRKRPLSHIMTLVKKDFLGPSPQRHWLRFAWVYVKCVVFGGFLFSGCFGFLVFLMMGSIPDALATEMSSLSQGEMVALMQTIWSGLISAMLTIGLPACMMFTVLITLERYSTVLKNGAF
ncbi:hypothetical protein [Yersinia bercovieri]|uniref:hypothetical protein n=1 Tax=Yersinia bercovieri TaxID=634 RepID=UPI00119D3DC1|nr:hypothetical protein [Yersinia bercovieri]